MRYLLPVLGALLVLIVACQTPVTLDAPKVDWTVKDQGGTLKLTWDAVTDAEGYKVYFDGSSSADTTLTATSIEITEPMKSVKVEAYNGTETADSTLVLSVTSTVTTINVHGLSQVGTDNAFGFNTTTGIGTAVDVSSGTSTTADFVMEDRAPDPMSFWSPTSYTPPVNAKDNASVVATGITDFNALKGATAPGSYSTKTEISQNAVYSLWIDPTGDGYSTDDHFGKAQVTSLSGAAVTLKVAYQMIPGLRWVVSD